MIRRLEMKNVLILGLFVFCAAVTAKDLGRDLDEVLDREPNVKITLGSGMLGLAKALTQDDKEAQAVLSGLDGLTIQVYEFEQEDEDNGLSDWIKKSVKALNKQGLQQIVKVVDGDEQVHIFANVQNEQLSDLTLMVYEPGDEFVFITMDGLINFADIKDITGQFDVDLDGLNVGL